MVKQVPFFGEMFRKDIFLNGTYIFIYIYIYPLSLMEVKRQHVCENPRPDPTAFKSRQVCASHETLRLSGDTSVGAHDLNHA